MEEIVFCPVKKSTRLVPEKCKSSSSASVAAETIFLLRSFSSISFRRKIFSREKFLARLTAGELIFEKSVHKIVELPFQYGFEIVRGEADAVVRDAAVGE